MIRKEPMGKNMKREPILDRAAVSNWGRAGESQLDRTERTSGIGQEKANGI